ncbi:hypothetical protein UFOVP1666_47 [uncultured Caudovirales phage]|uniref:Uncharacterized protein n=1 Tax=uncultured Caudovirales phage TaxID=2100421 RepID=A0A6J5P7V9_9CAUD|nr:hypothetical protein UFOVP867_2 [uncultured Caudovirales phage]CAB4171129.1 hypothetical protein UFOVP913_196 [uncultured Caudovirales phage]CAB4176730.1 hypothetical protein UFOVP993_52 [uncultured Caudovirales phage]CAB4223001.1 hypothetical protein UFOVP1666_47 [uncultured Caudovirales phage]
MLKVQGHPGLYRDEETKAIINRSSDHDKYIQNRDRKLQEMQDIQNLKSDVNDIKDMLNVIVKNLKERNT